MTKKIKITDLPAKKAKGVKGGGGEIGAKSDPKYAPTYKPTATITTKDRL